MSYRKTAVALLAVAFLLLPLGISTGADGANELTIDSEKLHVGSFNERSSGTVSVTIENSSTTELIVDVYVTWLNGNWNNAGDRLTEATGVKIPAKVGNTNGVSTVDLSFRISSPGTHYVSIWFMPESYFPADGVSMNQETVKIDVDSSVWSNPATYVVLVIVILVVVVAVYLRLRNTRTPKTKGRFTDMDKERKAQKERPKIKDEPVIPRHVPDDVDDHFIKEEPVAPAPAPVKGTQKQEYTGKVTKTKTKQQSSSPKRKSDPTSRKSSKRK